MHPFQGKTRYLDSSAVRWVLFARTLVATLFLLTALTFEWTGTEKLLTFRATPIYVYAGATYFSSLALAWLSARRRGWAPLVFHYVLTGFDLIVVTWLSLVTGGSASPFLFLYLLIIVGAAILGIRRMAVLTSALSMIGLGSVFLLEWWGKLPSDFLMQPHRANSSDLLATAFYNISAYYLVGILSSYLSERVRLAGEEIDRRDVDISILRGLQERIIENVPSGLITVDNLGRILLFNRQAERILGLSGAKLWGFDLRQLIPGLVLHPSGVDERAEIDYRHPDGKPRSLGYSVSGIRLDARRDGLVVIFQDLTRMKELEGVVLRQARLAAVGEMAAGLAHELRNPLGSISGCLQLLRQQVAQMGDDERELLAIALREIDGLNHLVDDFLTYARPSRREPSLLSPGDLFAGVVESVRVSPLMPDDFSYAGEVAADLKLRADAHTLRQVFLNLVTNALQAGATRLTLRGWKTDAEIALEIEDNGAGFSPEAMHRLFEPFYTTRPEGVGLGLAIVYRVMEQHRGSVTVRSVPGQTVMKLTFPLDGVSV